MYEHNSFKIPLRLVECCLLFSSQKQLTQAHLVRGTCDETEVHQIQIKSFLFDKSEVNVFMLGGKETPQIIMLRSRETAQGVTASPARWTAEFRSKNPSRE